MGKSYNLYWAVQAGAEKPKKTKTRRNIDYSAIQMEKARSATATSAARLREGYNPATGLYEPSAMTARTPPGACLSLLL